MDTYSWYGVKDIDPEDPNRYDMAEMDESLNFLDDIIQTEVKEHLGGDHSRMFISGFSQGGFLTYYLGLTSPYQFAGLIPFAAIIISPIADRIEATREKHKLEEKSKTLPILHLHGERDILFQKDRLKANLARTIIDNY